MSIENLTGKVHSSMYCQCRARGYAAPVDVLMDIGVLTKKCHEDWRYGRVDYLERVCTTNLLTLSEIMKIICSYAQANRLKPSFCFYKRWGMKKSNGQGHKPVVPLRFSKSGEMRIEQAYATHYVDSAMVAELKASSIPAEQPE